MYIFCNCLLDCIHTCILYINYVHVVKLYMYFLGCVFEIEDNTHHHCVLADSTRPSIRMQTKSKADNF